MYARRLNDKGLEQFTIYIRDLRSGKTPVTPSYLLDADEWSENLDISVEVDIPVFASRFELGCYLVDIFQEVDIQPYIGDSGFWSWFALLWFEQLCVKKADLLSPAREENYVLSEKYTNRPRHSIYMTWQLVNRYGDDVRFMLNKEPHTRGEITEQLMARQDILSSEGVMKLANTLYKDEETGSFKRGAGGRTSSGCVARYILVLQQLGRTFDIFSTTKEELAQLLPTEFNRFTNE